ncbi:MAG: hypothetical protein Q8P42_12980 [Gallionella sp.]|nr:hypothetical protein [Gallionella sp.]
MEKVKLTAGRIADFKCDEGKAQSFLWCAEVPGLGVSIKKPALLPAWK